MTYTPHHIARFGVGIEGGPTSGMALAPREEKDLALILRHASERDLVVQVWGGGTHSGFGKPPPPDLVVSMEHFGEIEVWEPDDLTIVVGAGARIADVESRLAERNQTLVMSERPSGGTIGGSVAAGMSSLRRGRLFGIRERVLEVTMITGDGRTVRSGGRVVKNVTGYDLHRLAVGAFGSLGVIISVCLKLWPTPPSSATVTLDDPEEAQLVARPLAVLDVNGAHKLFTWGTEAEVEAHLDRLGGIAVPGLDWPEDPSGEWRWSLRIPPALVSEAVDRVPDGWTYVAVMGVGEIRAASADHEGAADLREWAESLGGSLVVAAGDPDLFDPWGSPPPALDQQRRLIAQFDPRRVINPGRLPGGL